MRKVFTNWLLIILVATTMQLISCKPKNSYYPEQKESKDTVITHPDTSKGEGWTLDTTFRIPTNGDDNNTVRYDTAIKKTHKNGHDGIAKKKNKDKTGQSHIKKPNKNDPKKIRDASLAYSFFNKIKKFETKDIRVLVKRTSNQGEVRDDLREIEIEQDDRINNDTNIIKSISIRGYKNLTVSVVYDSEDFKITPVNTTEKQVLDTVEGNQWHWRVKAICDKKNSDLVIRVLAEEPGGKTVKKDERRIAITILIDHGTGLRRAWNWMLEHPEVSIPSVIIPVVSVLFARRRKKQKEGG